MKKTQKRLLIIALILVSSLAVAAVSSLLTREWSTNVTRGSVMEMDLIQDAVTGTVVPGQTLAISPVVKNAGTEECIAFVKVTVPTYGASSTPAYTYDVDSSWTKVGGSGGTAVYGYNGTLDYNDETTAPMDGITLKNMEVSDFLDIQDFNIQVTGYLAETSEYGSDPETAWGQIGE